MKPSDFLLGVLDFFAVLMPGAVVTWLAAIHVSELGAYLDVTATENDASRALGWVLIFFASYVFGHFVFMVGSGFDRLYDRWRQWRHPKNHDRTYLAAKQVYRDVSPSVSEGHFTTLKWAKAYVQIRSPAARLEIDRFDANSKFFRGFVVVSLLLALHFGEEGRSALAVGCVVLAALSLWRYCDQRWKASELSYATAAMLHSIAVASASKSDDKEE